jgi:hypothetical protein
VIKQAIYTGYSEEYFTSQRRGKREKIKYFRINSDMKDNTQFYLIWFDFITQTGQKVTSPEKFEIDCTECFDERGYVFKDVLINKFKNMFHEQLAKKVD